MEKKEMYAEMNEQARALCSVTDRWVSNLANVSALIFQTLPELNWAGFYLAGADEVLYLGPFQGKPACIVIPKGKGVCGTAYETRELQLVPDVHQFPGHIACDSASRSEIVVPLIRDGKVLGVLDIDSPVLNRFDEADAAGLRETCEILLAACTWSGMDL